MDTRHTAQAEAFCQAVFDFMVVFFQGADDLVFHVFREYRHDKFGMARIGGNFCRQHRHQNANGKFHVFRQDFGKGIFQVFKTCFDSE